MQNTEKFGLNLFEGGDPVLAENFNQNTKKLEQEITRRANIITGSYVGNGDASKTLTFDRQPALVIHGSEGGINICYHGCTSSIYLAFNYAQVSSNTISWDDTTHSMTIEGLGPANYDGREYTYMAFLVDA